MPILTYIFVLGEKMKFETMLCLTRTILAKNTITSSYKIIDVIESLVYEQDLMRAHFCSPFLWIRFLM